MLLTRPRLWKNEEYPFFRTELGFQSINLHKNKNYQQLFLKTFSKHILHNSKQVYDIFQYFYHTKHSEELKKLSF